MEMERLKVLSENEIAEIHDGALHILESTGVEFYEPQAVELLLDAGAKTERKKVFFPASLVQDSLARAPRKFTLHARDPKRNVTLGSGEVYIEPMIGRINVIDVNSGEKRRTNLQDAGDLIRVADAMDNYHVLHSGAVMPRIEGVAEGTAHAHGYLQAVRNSSKVIKGSGRGRQVAEDCITMASILAGCDKKELAKRPNLFTTINAISPLKHDHAQTQGLMVYAQHGVPVEVTAEPQLGATAPVTLAGALIQQTAEILSGIVLAQVVNPGTPVLFGTCAAAMDMKNGLIALGGVEGALMNVAHAQMARFYGLPSRGTGCNTDAKVLDMQAGYEKAITLLLTALAGNDIIFYPGTIEHALTIDYASLVIDNEICGIVLRALKGIRVDEKTKAMGLIEEVGSSGYYLGKKHTLAHMTEELLVTGLTDRDTRDDWVTKGSKRIDEKAREKARQIVNSHRAEALPDAIEMELERFVKEVEERERVANRQ